MDVLTCTTCGRQRHVRHFRHRMALRKADGSTHFIGKSTSECRYCYTERLSYGTEFLLAHRAKQGKINYALAKTQRKKRERLRREKLAAYARSQWAAKHRAQVLAHPVTKERTRVRQALRNTLPGTRINAFLSTYHQALTDLHARLEARPQLATKPSVAFEHDLLRLQESTKQAWVNLSPVDRGRLNAPQPVVQPRRGTC